MGKTMCDKGKKERKRQLEKTARYECRKCGTKVKRKDLVCKPVKL